MHTLRAENGYISMRYEADLQFNIVFSLVPTGDIHEGLRDTASVIYRMPEAYRASAVRNGRTLLESCRGARTMRPICNIGVSERRGRSLASRDRMHVVNGC